MKKNRREVRSLLLTLTSALFVAFVVVVGLVYYFGSSGTYRLRDILISPSALEKLSFSAQQQEGKGGGFVFNKIEFVRAEKSGRGWGRFAVGLAAYKDFYRQVASERSIPQIPDEVIEQFALVIPSTLTIFVRSADSSTTVFQQVQFIDGSDLFRVQAPPTHTQANTWIYFRRAGIYQEVVELFAPTLAQ